MSYYTTDAEQKEKLLKWWKEYGWATILGVVLAVVIVVGWQVYRRHQLHQAQQASLVYATMMSSSYAHDLSSAKSAANALSTQYSGTSYADMAHLWLAAQAANAKHYQQALSELKQVSEHGHMKALRQIAVLREASIQLQLKQPSLALKALDTVYDKGFIARVNEYKGDAYWQMNQPEKARAHYQQAVAQYQKAGVPAPAVAMKLAGVPNITPHHLNTTGSNA
ncbi:MAG: hypothetical protein COV52_09055 [Gammaproteobacteria bacterium CG11_big_fil_rev_8_21_14_0_20_46_22]|nr:MAG: hypothetical protein COW05_01670 [Gammaproteobacteria bacterium CG12_big_fil_rev_8_21_14_0_65_46_12]PIR10425.1 MAG: hypothetical protein COV52_09055 [Gammaproteobacteria bacterium CG11_big_fil_rev_8_21_14_0_20_46_22]